MKWSRSKIRTKLVRDPNPVSEGGGHREESADFKIAKGVPSLFAFFKPSTYEHVRLEVLWR
jgi:hypothetical protein